MLSVTKVINYNLSSSTAYLDVAVGFHYLFVSHLPGLVINSLKVVLDLYLSSIVNYYVLTGIRPHLCKVIKVSVPLTLF